MSDIYAVIDKSKKIRNSNGTGISSPEPVLDIYAQVDKSKKSTSKLQSIDERDTYDVICSGDVCYNTPDITAIKDDALYDLASGPVCSQLGKSKSTTRINGHDNSERNKRNLRIEDKSPLPKLCLFVCLFVLIVLTVVCVTAIIVAFVLIAFLKSEIGVMIDSMNTSNTKIEKLQHTYELFSFESIKNLSCLQNRTEVIVSNVDKIANNLSSTGDRVWLVQFEIVNMIDDHKSNLSKQINYILSNMSTMLNIAQLEISTNFDIYRNANLYSVQKLTNDIINIILYISTQSHILQNASHIAELIQNNYEFESCTGINTFALPFKSGEYLIKTSGNVTRMNCTIYKYSCGDVTGRWRRVAYFNVNDSAASICPHGLMPENNPLACRINSETGGCSTVVYSISENYKCVLGAVHGYSKGTPDGFGRHNRPSQNPKIMDNYVDGVIFTYGSPKNHIWTYAASHNSNTDCTPSSSLNIGNNTHPQYTCDIISSCERGRICDYNLLWANNEGIGSPIFFRELPIHTHDNIEMRVCRDESRLNEDFLLTFFVIYVK